MSNADTRAALAAALSTVDGVTGYARRPNVTKPGDAWPMWRGSERADGWGYLETWAVVIVLPGAEDTADAFADEHQAALDAALRPVLHVDSFAPATLPSSAGDLFALMITGRSE